MERELIYKSKKEPSPANSFKKVVSAQELLGRYTSNYGEKLGKNGHTIKENPSKWEY